MIIIQRRRRLAALIASTTIALAGIAAGTAQPASAFGRVKTSEFKILRSGFDIGGPTWAASAPTDKAALTWDSAWYGILPTVTGTLHFDGVTGNCARVRVRSYDKTGALLSPVTFSPTECVFSNGHIARPFIVKGSAGATEVSISLQTKVNAAGAPWGSIGSKTFELGPVIKTADVLISRVEFDFGAGPFTGGTFADPGTLTWKVDGNEPYPVLTGTLAMKEADDLCGRMRLKYISSYTGGVVDNSYGTEHCVTNDNLYEFDINLSNYLKANLQVDSVKVIIEGRPNGGTWTTRGAYTVPLP